MQQILHSLVLLIATLVCQEAPAEEENQPNHPDPAKPVAAQRFPYQPNQNQTHSSHSTPLHHCTRTARSSAQSLSMHSQSSLQRRKTEYDNISIYRILRLYESTKTIDRLRSSSTKTRSSPPVANPNKTPKSPAATVSKTTSLLPQHLL